MNYRKKFLIALLLIAIFIVIDFSHIGLTKRVVSKVGSALTDPNKVAICKEDIHPITVSEAQKNRKFYKTISSAKSVTFIGDSITGGGKNGGCGWYEPLMKAFPNITVNKQAWNGYTIQMLLNRKDEILKTPSDLYVIAVGVNDVRSRNPEIAAMDSNTYIQRINQMVINIKKSNPKAEIIFIGLWPSDRIDPISQLPEKERIELTKAYSKALSDYAKQDGYLFIDPFDEIDHAFKKDGASKYLVDYIHPNNSNGIEFYSKAVLEKASLL
ncbi:SGNH/GDSL hydrolase family protein [Acinetobacter radioresistens]|uniref:SGNH/GDSL hydrolase family protein n=1 Tax=Acinetobacter radioresistens TaxID=40216 RepID=UPI00061927B0|nr:SGNH/GDSL hydrolase family protein [Acinetobacter radioresistens]